MERVQEFALKPESLQIESARERARDSTVPKPKAWIQQRYIFGVMSFLCLMMLLILKANLPIGLVAMVESKRDNSTENTTEEEGEFDWNMELQGNILSAYFYGYVTTQFLGGYAANRWGGKHVVGLGVALSGVFALLSPEGARLGGPWTLFTIRVLQGMSSGVILPGIHLMFSLWFPAEERTSFSGAIFSGMHLGTVIGMSISGPLTKWPLEGGGWPMVFYFFGAIGVFLYIPWCFLCYDSPEVHPRISQEERDYIRKALGIENECRKTLPLPWKKILTDIHIWSAFIFHWGTGIVLYALLSDIPTYMKKVLNFDIEKLAFLSALPFLVTWISSSFCGMLSQWLRTQGYLSHIMAYKIFNGVAALGPTLCLLIITQIGHQPDVIVILLATSGVLMGAFFGGSYVNHLDLALNYAGPLAGILYTFVNTSGIIIPPTFAAIVQDDGIVLDGCRCRRLENLCLLVSSGSLLYQDFLLWKEGEVINGEHTIARWSIAFYLVAGISALTYLIYLIFGSVEERPWNKVEDLEEGKK